MHTSSHRRSSAILFVIMTTPFVMGAQSNGLVRGSVTDAQSNEALPSASVVLIGTGLGTATDPEGRFALRNIPAGSYIMRVSYIGYQTVELTLTLSPGEDLVKDISLSPVGIEGEAVTVTAQARGQKAAINEQLASPRIVNVVSSARIQELPDANAAEAVGRLPGVSIVRSAGEGAQVVIRGLQPKYNVVTVDGVRMASSGANDRSTDLSMISAYMLEGIEVMKAVTPDQDADALGGTINFKMRQAGSGKDGPGFSILAEGAYNGLSTPNRLNNYKLVASGEGRFLEDVFGVFVQMNVERRNLASHDFGASYANLGRSMTQYITSSLNLTDNTRDRRRLNGVVALDMALPNGKIGLSNFVSSGSTDAVSRGESFNVQSNFRTYTLSSSLSDLTMVTNALSLEHSLWWFRVDAKLSHTFSRTETPDDWTVGFQLSPAGLSQFISAADLRPQDIPRSALVDPASTTLNTLVTGSSDTKERAVTGAVDLSSQLTITGGITADFKFGGKFRRQTRSYDYDQYTGQGLGLQSATFVDSLIASHFAETQQYVNTTSIPLQPFVDARYSYDGFLDGEYPMSVPMSWAMVSEMVRYVRSQKDLIAQRNHIAYFHDQFNSATRDYDGREDVTAGYFMTTLNIGDALSVIPGVRYQRQSRTYTSSRGMQTTASATGGSYTHIDTTITRVHAHWLPALSVRYKPVEWFDIRLAHTTTLAYPDYNAVIPRIDVAVGTAIAWNNVDLVPSRSRNYDIYLSFYSNTIGLFTLGGFYKQIDDMIYPSSFYVSGAAVLPYYPPGTATTPPSGTFNVTTFVNNKRRAEDVGVELDWQTHFWYLPRPFDGFVLSVNYTHVYSRAEYPFTDTRRVGRVFEYVDTFYVARLLHQPDDIVNVSLGFDYGGFSMRLSMLHQGDVFSGTDFWPQLRSSTDAYTRWDLAVRQELPWAGWEVYGDINNINGTSDRSLIHALTGVPRSDQSYGMTADAGIRWQF